MTTALEYSVIIHEAGGRRTFGRSACAARLLLTGGID